MQLNDTKIQEFGRNDGIQSILHCQDQFFTSEGYLLLLTSNLCLEFMRWRGFFLLSFEVVSKMKKLENIS